MHEYTIGKELDLKREQETTLSTPSLRSTLVLKMMYLTFDLLYGFKRTLPKVKVLEILARYPYWAWENSSYHGLSRLFSQSGEPDGEKTRELLHVIELGRSSQDNEQYHLLLVDSIIHQKKIKLGWLRHYLMPRLMAFGYYYFTRLLYAFRPAWSFAMNAAFESHAEHEYMTMAKENPQWDNEPVDSPYFEYYPGQKSLNDLLRRIALDERDHMNHSLQEAERLLSQILH
jgi:hypothetical protein